MIYLGSDHGGFSLKKEIMKKLDGLRYEYVDLGNKSLDPEDDYTDYSFAVAERVAEEYDGSLPWKDAVKGILFCRSSAGVVIAANKVKGIRCASAFDEVSAKKSREHNDSNILALSGDWLKPNEAIKVLMIWLKTDFSDEKRHIRRINKITEYENR